MKSYKNLNMFFSPNKIISFYVRGTKAHVTILMVKQSLFLNNGIRKKEQVDGYAVTFIFNKKEWETLRNRYKLSLNVSLNITASTAVGALIVATAPTPAPASTATTTTTALTTKCYILCTCDVETCPLKKKA